MASRVQRTNGRHSPLAVDTGSPGIVPYAAKVKDRPAPSLCFVSGVKPSAWYPFKLKQSEVDVLQLCSTRTSVEHAVRTWCMWGHGPASYVSAVDGSGLHVRSSLNLPG